MAEARIEFYTFDADDVAHRYETGSNALLPFVTEHLIESQTHNLPWVELLDAFRVWERKARPAELPMKSQAVKDALKRHNILYVRTTVNNKDFYGVKGFSLRDLQAREPAPQLEAS